MDVPGPAEADPAQWAPAGIRPPAPVVDEYRRRGIWRTDHLLTDLYRQARDRPDAPAIIGYRSDGIRETLSWSRFADQVERFASGLRALGVGPGQVVAVQLPNWWETGALILAVLRTGAVVAPLIPAIRHRELERILASLRVTVMVTVGQWQGFDHSAALAEMAGRLPQLRHRVVMGQKTDGTEVDFAAHFVRTSWAAEFPLPPADLDGLRRRTRAMNGRCQGFYCGAEVASLLRAGGIADRAEVRA